MSNLNLILCTDIIRDSSQSRVSRLGERRGAAHIRQVIRPSFRFCIQPYILLPSSIMAGTQKDVYLVIGGSGFLGRHIVQQLLARGDNVSVFDIVQRYDDVPFFSGDISEKEQVAAVLRRVRHPLQEF